MARSLFLLSSLVSLALGQGSLAPAISAPASASAGSCGGCYVIADVAAVVFGEEQIQQTATNVVSVGVGKNGTQVTTSFVQPGGAFTFVPTGLITGQAFGFPAGSTVVVGGATLTSPTAYEVFTAYSITSLTVSDGKCQTSSGPAIQLPSAFSVPIPDGANSDFIFEAEESFINKIGGVSCLPGGASVSTTTQIPVSTTTVSNTITGPLRPTPVAVSTISTGTARSTISALPDSETSSSTSSSSQNTGTGALKPSTSVQTVPLGGNATGTLVISGNSTGIITGSGPSATIIPFTGAGSTLSKPSVQIGLAIAFFLPGILAWRL